jgi:Family of unknown function (DUF6788)
LVASTNCAPEPADERSTKGETHEETSIRRVSASFPCAWSSNCDRRPSGDRRDHRHRPYAYFTPKPAGRGRARYVPAGLVAAVRARLARGEQVAAVIAEISAINAELLARRELQ